MQGLLKFFITLAIIFSSEQQSRTPHSDTGLFILQWYKYKIIVILGGTLDIVLSGNTLNVVTVHITWIADWHLTVLQEGLSIPSPLLTYALRLHTYWMCLRQQLKSETSPLPFLFGMQEHYFPAAKRIMYLCILVTAYFIKARCSSLPSAESFMSHILTDFCDCGCPAHHTVELLA